MKPVRSACAVAITAFSLLTSTAHADVEDLGNPDAYVSRNTGDVGAVVLFFDIPPRASASRRTVEGQCEFALTPAVDSSDVAVAVNGSAVTTQANPADGLAAATGIRCELRSPSGTTVVERALPGSLATVDGVVPLRLTPLTLCASVSVLWTDGVFQTMETPHCVSP